MTLGEGKGHRLSHLSLSLNFGSRLGFGFSFELGDLGEHRHLHFSLSSREGLV